MPIDETEDATPPPVAPSHDAITFPVVGIGASAGGLKALLTFFEHMPSGTGMAFVVVIHLSPKHESSLDAVLQNVTRMPVIQVNETTRIERDHIYVISPNKQLTIQDGVLDLADAVRKDGRSAAIDLFFRTLAAAHNEHAVAIVMSGTGADGAVGLKNVKEHGGITMAQLPQDAEYDTMPRNAVGTGIVDFVLPAAEMPQRLLHVWQNMQQIVLPSEAAAAPATGEAMRDDEALRDILGMLRVRTGHDFNQYKRATVLRRIERRLQVNQLRDLPTYRAFLQDHPAETRALLKDMLISVTNFFRDREAFEALEREAIPAVFQGKSGTDQVRVWVAGCATGEEAYSLAMLLAEQAQEMTNPPELQVFATDIDEDAIQFARAGMYPEAIAADVSAARLRRFFVKEGGGYRVQKSIRELVMFAPHNLLKDPPFSKLDLAACRNLLIYLNRDIQTRVLEVFHFALRPHGFLFLGSSESVDEADDAFVPVDKSHRIFRPQPRLRATTGIPTPDTLPGTPRIVPTYIVPPMPRRTGAFADLHQSLLEHYAPPSVVVNDQYEIVHLSENAGRFLQFAGGEPSLNLMKVVNPELRLELRAGLFQAMQSMKSNSARVLMHDGGAPSQVHLTIHPVSDAGGGRAYALVLFDEHAVDEAEPRATEATSERLPLIEQLEMELTNTKEQLRTTIEQYETQNEELKASNEELQAINEELRSATEELETSKEELQSINEELTTVNQELKTKIDETTSINNDLQNFISSTEMAVMFVDRGMRLMRFTPPARDIFNVIASDVGRPLLDITHRLDYPELESDIQTVFETLRVVEREVTSVTQRYYIARLLPYRTLEDRIDGAVLTFIDITSRKDAEERLRRSEDWMRFVVESVRDYAIVTMDTGGRINSWNAGAERLFAWTADEIVGKPADTLFTQEDRDAGVPEEEMRRARTEGRAEDERWHVKRDGTRFYVSGVMVPLIDGHLYGYVKVARDLTEKQQLDSARLKTYEAERESREASEDAGRQKDQFLATLSHELRNPLNLILMQAQLLLRNDIFKDPKGRHTAEVIYQTAATQARLVDDLLDVSRVMTGKLAVQQQLVPLSYIVGDSIGAVSREAEQKRIVLELDLTAEPLIVQADPVRVRQIAWNLLSNAIKFTPDGGHVYVTLKRDGDEARLDIADTGQGIEPRLLPHMFEMFRQSDASDLSRRQGGLGIGLALVRQLVDLHGGRIEVHSDGIGKGARFTVWLPIYVVPVPENHEVDAAKRILTPGPPPRVGTASRLTGLSVLIVDDAPDAANALHELLEMEGAAVRSASSGRAALDLAARERFDVVVSDLAMPGMDGLALLRALHETPLNPGTPAIACTGFNRPKDIEMAHEAGFAAHLGKPIGVAELVDTILRVTGAARRDGGPRRRDS
jgi:two-component system CheB/CheR fusion protein